MPLAGMINLLPLVWFFVALELTVPAEAVSYVVEPFEIGSPESWELRLHQEERGGWMNVSLSNDSLFGRHSLRYEYDVLRSETWGGFLDLAKVLSGERTFNCMGATHISFWYKIVQPQSQPERAHLRLVLLDGKNCQEECRDGANLEQYYSFHYIFDGAPTDEWKEIKIELRGDGDPSSPFWQTGWSGVIENGVLDLDAIQGWRLEVNIDGQAADGSTSAGVVLIDQLACIDDNGDLLGAALEYNGSFEAAVAKGIWTEEISSSELSRNLTHTSFMNGTMEWNFTIEQSTSSGGRIELEHLAPWPAYYNLSDATSVSLEYLVGAAASQPGRTTFQLALLDGSSCNSTCHSYPPTGNEVYTAFRFILDSSGEGQLTFPFAGSMDLRDLFWYAGEPKQFGFEARSRVTGFRFELTVDGDGTVGSLITGIINLHNLTADSVQSLGPGDSQDLDTDCAVDPDFEFDVRLNGVKKIEFQSRNCCELCTADPDCLYALTTADSCYLTSFMDPMSIVLKDTEFERTSITTFWQYNSMKRGDFCSICVCRAEDQTIDCRKKDLLIVPKTFSPMNATQQMWRPKVLDLRENPRLPILGADALKNISDSLVELRLPTNLRHLAETSVSTLPALDAIAFESPSHQLINAISAPNQSFNSICCSRGGTLALSFPSPGLTFCKLDADVPGIDAVYEEFIEYFGGEQLATLRPSSSFMFEAAQSAEKCAEYCAIRDGCNYFSYDGRWTNAEPICRLLVTEGTRSRVCCNSGDYGDREGTRPGWVSGRVPRSRHLLDDAVVHTSPSRLVADEETEYTAIYHVKLGSMPTRGAVWVEPSLASSSIFRASFSPQRVILYDNETVAEIVVRISWISNPREKTLAIKNMIKSCDKAFLPTAQFPEESTVYVEVRLSRQSLLLPLSIAIPCTVVILLALVLLYLHINKRRSDSLWVVKSSELYFKDPPEVAGQGTFGVVLLAEYRGTQVAVKRVIPPKGQRGGSSTRGNSNLGNGSTLQRVAFEDEASIGDEIVNDGGTNENASDDLRGSISGLKSGLQSGLKSGLTSKSYVSSVFKGKGVLSALGWLDEYTILKRDFLEEMKRLSTLRHPCITTVMGAVIGRGEEPMLVMEYMDHGSLHDLLHNETMMFDADIILPILRDIAQGIRFLHSADPPIIHGDLKARNILVDSKLRAKVADFGLTQKKQLGCVGTPFWMAPELIRGDCVNNEATDVYAFGIVLYEVYSRKDPYTGEKAVEVLEKVADHKIAYRPPCPPNCPEEIRQLMTNCLHDDPSRRPTFKELDLHFKRLETSNAEPGETHFSRQIKKVHQTDRLLYDVFPRHIAQALRDGKKVQPEHRDVVTIFFSDIVGFTNISATLPPIKVSDMLDRLYNRFDELSRKHDIFKVETIGDAYMAVTNLVKDQGDHAKLIAEFAVDAVRAANETLIDLEDPERGCVKIRVGFHSGPVVANVVGSRNPRYCLFGDTVNTASRMESNSQVNRIHCSEAAAKLVRQQHPSMPIRSRGAITVKGKGEMQTYWINEEGQGSLHFNDSAGQMGSDYTGSGPLLAPRRSSTRNRKREASRPRTLRPKTPSDSSISNHLGNGLGSILFGNKEASTTPRHRSARPFSSTTPDQ